MNALDQSFSALQARRLLTLFLLGSAWVFGLGADADQAAWLANLIGVAAGLGLVGIYLLLQGHYPGKTLVEFLPLLLGRIPGKCLGLLYILYFLYLASRVTRDFAELTVTTLLPGTPVGVIAVVLLLVAAYCLRHGREVLARVTELLLPLGLIPLVIVTLLILPQLRAERLQPWLGPGLKPLLLAAFPYTITVPYGEAVVFLMLWAGVLGKRSGAALWGTAVAGLVLTYLSMIETSALGHHLVKTAQFPLLQMVRQVTVSDVMDRIDAVVTLMITLGGFTKVAVFYWAAAAGLGQWLGLRDHRPLILPLLTIAAPLSLGMAQSYPEHIKVGLRMVPFLLHVPLQIVVPVLLLTVAQIRKWAAELEPGGAEGK